MNRKTPDRIPPASPARIRDSRIARKRTRESAKELVDEGQFFETRAVDGVEDMPDTVSEVRTRQVLEDDVPTEYLNQD
jgi:hypothetical protein